jgi:uncharacterized protein YukJ
VFTSDNFKHPMTRALRRLPQGKNILENKAGGAALDYVRGGLFDRKQMRTVPATRPGPNNDLHELLNSQLQKAIRQGDAELYVFGSFWGKESKPDKIFGFSPGQGIHNVHMNQGNRGRFARDNGTWQDGGILIHFPAQNRWSAAFLSFQSQTFDTDDRTGHPRQQLVKKSGRLTPQRANAWSRLVNRFAKWRSQKAAATSKLRSSWRLQRSRPSTPRGAIAAGANRRFTAKSLRARLGN